MRLRKMLATVSATILTSTLLSAIPAVGTPAANLPTLPSLFPKSLVSPSAPTSGLGSLAKSVITYNQATDPSCSSVVVDATVCDPNSNLLVSSETEDFPSVSQSVTGKVFKHVGGKRGVMETSWSFWGWRNTDKIGPETPVAGQTVYARWYDGTTANGAWSPRFYAKSGEDGTYKIALRDFVDSQGVTHRFTGRGAGTNSSPKDQLVRVGVQTSEYRLVWAPNNGNSLSKSVVTNGLADNVRWNGNTITGYNFSLADKDFNGPAMNGVTVTKTSESTPGTCFASLAAKYFKITGTVFWDYAQNKFRNFDPSPYDDRVYPSDDDWQPTLQSTMGDEPARGEDLNYYVIAWVPVDKGSENGLAKPKSANVGWAKVKNDGTYEILVEGSLLEGSPSSGSISLLDRSDRLNHIMVQLVQTSGGEPSLNGSRIENAHTIDSQYGFWNPTAEQFRSWADGGGTGTGTGIKQRTEGACASNTAYSTLYNVNFAMFPWQAVLQTRLNNSDEWSQRTTAVKSDSVQVKISGLAPLGTYRLFADSSTLLVDSFETDMNGEWSGTFTTENMDNPTWHDTEHQLNVVLPGVDSVDLAKSPIVANSILNLVPYRANANPVDLTVNEAVTDSAKTLQLTGMPVPQIQSCAWDGGQPNGLDIAADVASNSCKISGTPTQSGSFPTSVKILTDKDNGQPTTWNLTVKVHPKVLAQQAGAVAGSGESAVAKSAGVGEQFFGQVEVLKDRANRSMTFSVSNSRGEIAEAGDGTFDLGYGLKLYQGSGQIIGTPTLGNNETSATVTFKVSVKDADGLAAWSSGRVQAPVPFTINIAPPLRLVDPVMPTAIAGEEFKNPDGSPIQIWVQGGNPSGSAGNINSYASMTLQTTSRGDEILDVKTFTDWGFSSQQATLGSGKVLKLAGAASPDKVKTPTVLYLPVKVEDSYGRVLDGTTKHTLAQIKARTSPLNGSEGWIRMIVLPKISPNAFKDGTVGTKYPANSIADALKSGTGQDGIGKSLTFEGKTSTYSWENFSYSATGLPAGLNMSPDGTITGTPQATTPLDGQPISVTLTGKAGTLAAGTTLTLQVPLKVHSDFKVAAKSVSAKAIGGTSYTAESPLRTDKNRSVSATINPTGGKSPYTYKLQVKREGVWRDARSESGRYLIPNQDENPSGLKLDSQGNIIGETLGNEAFPEMRIVVSDSDQVSCANSGGEVKPCEDFVSLNLTREDTRKPRLSTDREILDLKSTSSGAVPIVEGSGQYTQLRLTSNSNFPAGLNLKVSCTSCNPAQEVTLTSATMTEQIVGDGVKPTDFKFVAEYDETKPKVGKYPGAFTIFVKDLNGNLSDAIKIAIEITDTRLPVPATSNPGKITGPEEGVSLKQKPANYNAKDFFDTHSADIECYAPTAWDFSKGCPSEAQAKTIPLQNLPGMHLLPDGTLSGTPDKGTAGTRNLSVRAITKTGTISNPVVIPVVVAPSTLELRPQTPVGVVSGEPTYTWDFSPASGGADTKHYQLMKNGKKVESCSFANGTGENSKKVVMTCSSPSVLTESGANFTLEVYTQDGGDKSKVTRSFALDFTTVDQLKIIDDAIPPTAEGANYTSRDGSTFRFVTSGGLGPYTFGFNDGSPHERVTASPDTCKGGWRLYSTGSMGTLASKVDTGLCLKADGSITGKVAEGSTGVVDLSKLKVTDSMGRTATIAKNQNKSFTISSHLEIQSLYPDTDNALVRDKNQALSPEGEACTDSSTCSLAVATITGGARPLREVQILGLDQFVNLVGDSTVTLNEKNNWTQTLPLAKPADGRFKVSLDGDTGDLSLKFSGNFSKITGPGLAATVKVTGGAGQLKTKPVYIQVNTDLKFVEPAGTPAGSDVDVKDPPKNPSDPITKPDSLGDLTPDEWSKIEEKLDPTLPTVGLGLDKDAVSDAQTNPIKVPKLVEGGVPPYHFTTEPCNAKVNNRAAAHSTEQVDCAIGDTGLYLDYYTGEIYGTPKEGVDTTAVVIVVDSDSPPQHKRSNLVVSIADPRKPSVTSGQVLNADKKTPNGSATVSLQDGSGEYAACAVSATDPAPVPAWLSATFDKQNRVCQLKWNGLPADGAEKYSVTLKVKDANGNWNTTDGNETGAVVAAQSVTLKISDTREPSWPSGMPDEFTATEGQPFDKSLPTSTSGDGTQITNWTVEGDFPEGITFSNGKLSGTSTAIGTYPLTLIGTAANGNKITKVVNLTVTDSDLRLILPAFPKATEGENYPVTGTIQPLTAKVGDSDCTDCTFAVVNTSGSEEKTPVEVSVDPNSGELTFGTWPTDTKTTTVEFRVTRGKATRTVKAIISADSQLSLSPTSLPFVTVGEASTECVVVTGGTGVGYNLTGGGTTPDSSQPGKFCLNIPTSDSDAGTIKEVSVTATDQVSESDTAVQNRSSFTLYLPVRGELSLAKPNDVTVKKNQGMTSFTPTLSGKLCFPDYSQDPVQCSRDGENTKWELVNAPEGITIDEATGAISGTPTRLFDDDITVKVTKTKGDYSSAANTSFRLKVKTDLEVSAPPADTTVDTEPDGSGKVSEGGKDKGKQLLPDKTTPSSTDPTSSTGKYSIPGVTPNGNGNYPITVNVGGEEKPTGFALTPDGKIVGSLNPGIVTSPDGKKISFPVVLTETDSNGNTSTTDPVTVQFTLTDKRPPAMSDTTVSAEVGKPAKGTLSGVDPSSETGKPKYSGFTCSAKSPALLNAPTMGTDITVNEDGTWSIAETFVPSATDESGEATWTCNGTITAANGQTVPGSFTLEMNDRRVPTFSSDRERYVWEGRSLPPFPVVGSWITSPETDFSVPPLRTITISNLPDGMKVVKSNGEEWASSGGGSNPKTWTCDLSEGNETCNITGAPKQGTTNRYVVEINATGKNGVTVTDYPTVVNYAAALMLTPTGTAASHATVGGNYTGTVAVADYARPQNLTDDNIYNGTTGTTPAGDTIPAQNNQKAWVNTYALGDSLPAGAADYPEWAAPKVTVNGETGWKAKLVDADPATHISGCDEMTTNYQSGSGSFDCKTLLKKNVELTHDGIFAAEDIGAHNLTVTLTDGHGITRSLPVTVNVYAPLAWARAPFKTETSGADAVLNPNKGITAGKPFVDEAGGVIYAEVTGGNPADYNTVLAPHGTDLTYDQTKSGAGYAGVEPIWCQAQFDSGLKPSRPKCYPVAGLVPSGASGSKDTPYSGEGVFLLSNAKFVGTVPAGTNAGEYKGRVVVTDANHDILQKDFTIQVYSSLTTSSVNSNIPSGTRMKPYTSDGTASGSPVELFTIGGGGASSTSGSPDYSGYKCSFEPEIEGMSCSVDANGKVKLTGTPKRTHNGPIQVTVTDNTDSTRFVTQEINLEIKTDLMFTEPSNPPLGSSVVPETAPDGSQTLKIITEGTGESLTETIPIDVTGGDVMAGAKPGTPEGYVFHLTDKDGHPIIGAICPDNPATPDNESKVVDGSKTYDRICYPVGNTGLLLTSDGQMLGNPIPGTKSEDFVVVADHATSPNQKSAQLNIVIKDFRQPTAYPVNLDTTVGTTSASTPTLNGFVTHDSFTNPPNVTPSETFDSNQQAAASQKGFYSAFDDLNAWTKDKAPNSAKTCSAETLPQWLELDRTTGKITVKSGETVPSHTTEKPNKSGIMIPVADAIWPYKFCVWYVGENGMVSDPVTATVTVTDNREPTPDTTNDSRSHNQLKPGTPVVPAETEMGWNIPKDLLANTGKNIAKVGGNPTAFNPNFGSGFKDTSIPGVDAVATCDRSGDPVTCKFELQGTPTPEAAGKSYNLTYVLDLANGKKLTIHKEVQVDIYDLAVSATAMPVAWIGEPYTPGPVTVTGGGSNNTLSANAPSGSTIAGYDSGTGNFTAAGGDVWQPTDSDVAAATNGYLPVTLTVRDTSACGTWTVGTECPYKRDTMVNIPIAKRPSESVLQFDNPIIEGNSATSDPLLDPSSLANRAGTTQKVISAQSDSVKPIPDGAITIEGNKLKIGSNVPPGNYTVTVQTTVPGFGTFYRTVKFTVKDKPVPQKPEPKPESNPGSGTGKGNVDYRGLLRDIYGTVSGDNLIVRHPGQNREATALSVLDFFDKDTPGGVANASIVPAYPEYASLASGDWSHTAVLVRDDAYADSLVSGPLAAQLNAPIVLTPTPAMNVKTQHELVKRGFTRVIIVGNQVAVSENVAQTLRGAGFNVERIGGADRYSTATAVADRVLAERRETASSVFMATGENYPDALTASSAAIKQRGVVLLTPDGGKQADTAAWVQSGKMTSQVAIGGPAVRAIDSYKRPVASKIMGDNRYQTASAVAKTFFPSGPWRVVVATGMDFPDATIATAITAKTGAPVTLTPPTALAPVTKDYLRNSRKTIRKVDVLGSQRAVSSQVESEIVAAVVGK